MKKFFFSTLVFLACYIGPAFAQQVNYVTRAYPVPVTTTAAVCVPANNAMQALYIENIGGTNNAYFDFLPNTASASASPLLAASGNGNKWWPPGSAPRNGLSCVSTGGSTTVYVAIYTPS